MRSSTRWAFLMAGVLCLSFARSTAAQTWTPEDYQPLPTDATLVIGYEESPDFRVFGYVPRDKGSLGGSQDLFGFRHGDTVYFVTHLMATRELPDSDGTWENLQIALYKADYVGGGWVPRGFVTGPDGLEVTLDGRTYRFADAEWWDDYQNAWPNDPPILDWSEGDRVAVRFSVPTATPALSLVGAALLGLLLAIGGVRQLVWR